MPVESFKERVERLAKERNLSVAQLGNLAWDQGVPGTSQATLNSAMQGKRRPGKSLIEALAKVLAVDAAEFPEYGLAALRAVPDEREVGLDAALGEAREAATIVLAVDARLAPPGALGRAAKGSPPTEKRRPQKRPRRAQDSR